MISYNPSMEFKTIIEPFKIKSVESLPITTPEQRKEYLEVLLREISQIKHLVVKKAFEKIYKNYNQSQLRIGPHLS